ncbi:hypothetical protein [Miniphocaeibacter halophilus]|nr:hypothetical protein [Miniphocaeibacter halophilus]
MDLKTVATLTRNSMEMISKTYAHMDKDSFDKAKKVINSYF